MSDRARRTLFILLLAAGCLATIFCCFLNFRPGTVFFGKDQAVTFAAAASVLDGERPLLGPPSHVAGRHIGPFYYWYSSALLLLSGRNEFIAITLDLIVKLLGAALLVALSSWCAPAGLRLPAAAGAALAFAVRHYPPVFREFWQPDTLLFFSSLLLIVTYACLKYGRRFLVFFALCASMVLQIHFGALPFVLPLFIAVLCFSTARAVRCESALERAAGSPLVQLSGLAGLAALWFPPLIYEAAFPSNIEAMFRGLRQIAQPAGMKAAALNLYDFCAHFFLGTGRVGAGDFFTNPLQLASMLCALTAFAAAWRQMPGATRVLLGATFCAFPLYVLSLSGQGPDLYFYYLYALLPLPALYFGQACGGALALSSAALQAAARWKRALSAVLACLFVALFSYHWFESFERSVLRLSRAPIDGALSLAHAHETAALMRAGRESAGPFAVIGPGSTTIMEYAYYYFLGKDFWPLMLQAREMLEFDVFQRPLPQTRRGFLVACPVPPREFRKKMWKQLSGEWSRGLNLDSRSGVMTRRCLITRVHAAGG